MLANSERVNALIRRCSACRPDYGTKQARWELKEHGTRGFAKIPRLHPGGILETRNCVSRSYTILGTWVTLRVPGD